MFVVSSARALFAGGAWGRLERMVGDDGRVSAAVASVSSGPPLEVIAPTGIVLPGMPNLHSHAFQRALVGRTERAEPGSADSFWTWREAMYGLALRLDEEALEGVAFQLFVEMLEAGYTSVGEFHYLHHRPDGSPYGPPARLGQIVLAAARRAGIAIVLLPALYLHGGFDLAPTARQRRFVHRDVEGFLRLVEVLAREADPAAGVRVGVAPHSLRAVDLVAMADLVDGARALLGADVPIHVHVAEQVGEVEACLRALGRRPVEALLDRFELGPTWCLVHATHATASEIEAVARRGAVIGLCPTTEANLGDGFFPTETLLGAGGAFGIGTDSQVAVDPAEELRWLEYQARLRTGRRNLLALDGEPPHLGPTLWGRAVAGGARALGERAETWAPGARMDLVELDPDHPRLAGLSPPEALDAFVLGSAPGAVRTVLVGGRERVRAGRHVEREAAQAGYARALERLDARGAPR